MPFYGNSVTTLEVLDRTGAAIPVVNGSGSLISGRVEFSAGDGMQIDIDEDTEEIVLTATGQENSTAAYRRKFNTVISGGTYTDEEGVVQTYTGMPYYITSLGDARPGDTGNVDLLCSPCGQVGIYENGSIMDSGALPILDICPACVDCEDFEYIRLLTDRLKDWQIMQVDKNLYRSTDPTPGDMALFRQYQATIEYWNYLVHAQCIPLHLIHMSSSAFAINTGYYVKYCGTYTPVLVLDIATSPVLHKADIICSMTWHKHIPDGPGAPSFTVVDTSTGFRITVVLGSMSYKEARLFQIVVRTAEPVESVNVKATWLNSHLGASVQREKDI